MKNTLDYAKEYLLKKNFEFFTQSEQNGIAKTMFTYANHISEELLEQNKEMLAMLNKMYDEWVEVGISENQMSFYMKEIILINQKSKRQ